MLFYIRRLVLFFSEYQTELGISDDFHKRYATIEAEIQSDI